MITLIKLFKALNSSQAEYQLSLALIFGIISGFLPFFSLINLLIIFIVFSVNIPIGVYGIFTIIFTLLGSMLDPYFHQVGLSLLLDPAINSIWTSLYNSSLALWLNFNHTITLGSFTISLLLFLPVYFISKILFKKYRQVFQTMFKNSRFFSWLNPYDEKKLEKKVGLIRWWGSGLILSVFAVIILFFILLFDPIIKYTSEYILSKFTNTTVTIGQVESNIKNMKLEFKDINVVKNEQLNKIDGVLINIDTAHFLNKKLDIKLIDIQNINLDKTFVKSINNTKVKIEHKNEKSILDDFKLKLPNIDTLLEKEDLKSIKESQAIKQRFNDINVKWKDIGTNKINTIDTNKLKDDFNEIKALTKNIKTKDDLENVLIKSKTLENKIKLIQQDIKVYTVEYKKDKKILANDIKSIKTLPMEDYKYLTSKYTLNQDGALNIVSTYISDDVSNYIKAFVGYFNKIKPYLPLENEDEAVIRKKGKWIKFKEINPYPDFVLQKLIANILSKEFDKCNVNLSYNIDTKLNVSIINYKPKLLEVNEKLHLEQNNINISSNSIIEKSSLINSNLVTNFTKTKFLYKNPKNNSEKIIKTILEDINQFDINGKITSDIKNLDDMKISINSNLDKKLQKGFKKEAKQQLSKYKKKLKVKLKDKINSNVGNISDKEFNKYSKILGDKENIVENIKKELLNKYNSKKLKKKLKDKAKKELEKKLRNRLKGIK